MRWLPLLFVVVACGDDSIRVRLHDASPGEDALCPHSWRLSLCNPLTQAGCAASEKCTWLLDLISPVGGHLGCAPAGSLRLDEPCEYTFHGEAPCAVGYDSCARGLVCDATRDSVGQCRTICDHLTGAPCSEDDACVTRPDLFGFGNGGFYGGLCEAACDPLSDNDFDGSGSAFTATGSGCGGDADVGCYGYPSYGTPPLTTFTCMPHKTPGANLRHRFVCDEASGCAEPGPQIHVNSCSPGYLPLLYESSGSMTIICVAMCKPLDCFAGNCGTNDENRLGEAPHRCTDTDRIGTFNNAANGEHCQFLWSRELDDSGQLLRSKHTDTLGVCFDHSKYRYDSDNNGVITSADLTLPPCAALQDGYGSGSDRSDPLTYFGAADLGCVDSTRYVPGRQPRF